MSPEAGQAAVRLALFLIVAASLALFWTPRDSAEWVVLVLTIGLGIFLLVVVAILARISS